MQLCQCLLAQKKAVIRPNLNIPFLVSLKSAYSNQGWMNELGRDQYFMSSTRQGQSGELLWPQKGVALVFHLILTFLFPQNDLQLLWSNYGLSVLLRDTLVDGSQWGLSHQKQASYPLHHHQPFIFSDLKQKW